jgi:hypothetical protein
VESTSEYRREVLDTLRDLNSRTGRLEHVVLGDPHADDLTLGQRGGLVDLVRDLRLAVSSAHSAIKTLKRMGTVLIALTIVQLAKEIGVTELVGMLIRGVR